jgi:hypothetical protein
LASECAIDIRNPDLIVVSSTGRSAFAYHTETDGFDIVDMRLVESIEYPHGTKRRRRSA